MTAQVRNVSTLERKAREADAMARQCKTLGDKLMCDALMNAASYLRGEARKLLDIRRKSEADQGPGAAHIHIHTDDDYVKALPFERTQAAAP